MKRPLPTTTEVQAAMDQVLADVTSTGRKATIATVERRLGVPHATFYRNFASLIPGFQQHVNAQNESTTGPTQARRNNLEDDLRRLRLENEDLRRAVQIYCEAIRQLTMRNQQLENQLHQQESITTLSELQRSKRTTDRNRHPS